MINLPHGPDLLALARHTLLNELLPLLPPEKAYEARMAANAIAIAAREMQAQIAHEQDSAQQIAAFLQSAGVDAKTEPTEQSLAQAIRERRFDPLNNQPLQSLLMRLTLAKLAISNPKYLPSDYVHG
ncbi:MAG: hypothetical protein KA735_11015 [Burkholderiaceae bacterium]|nr:hypothetical protein [Burkholderiaceae bacterium]